MMDVLSAFWTTVTTVLGWIWTVLNMLFAIPIVGVFLQLGFYGLCAWFLYRLYQALPRRVKVFARERIAPQASWMSTPLRWFVVRRLANPEWLRQPGDPEPRVVEREVEVPVRMRRSFKEWLVSGVRWGIFYLIVFVLYLNWSLIAQLLPRIGG